MPGAMTLIEIKPHRGGWKVFEGPGVEPVFPEKQDAIDYAAKREVTLRGSTEIFEREPIRK
jgi:hypothetical protein